MIIFGLLLLLLVAAIVVVMLMAGDDTVTIGWDAINLNWTPTALVVFLLGAGTLLLLVLAFAALRSGTRRRVAKSQELRRLRKMDKEAQSTHTGPTASGPTASGPAPTGPSRGVDSTATGGSGDNSPYGPGASRLDNR